MTLLTGRDLRVDLGHARLLDGVDITLETGTLTGLIGPNGAGKTTVLRALLGLVPRASGTIVALGREVSTLTARERARVMSYLAQDRTIHWPLTVHALVALGRLPHRDPWRAPPPEDAAAIETALAQTEMTAFADRVATTLSGGERARALLAVALVANAPILLADEPVAALDPAHQFAVMDLLKRTAAKGRSVLVVLHDLALAAQYCDRLVLLDRGRCVAEGIPTQVLTAERLASVYGVRARAPLETPLLAPLETRP